RSARGQTRLAHRSCARVWSAGGRVGTGAAFRRCGDLFLGRERAAFYHGEGILANQERGTGELDADVAKLTQAFNGPERGDSTAFPFGSGDRSREHRLASCGIPPSSVSNWPFPVGSRISSRYPPPVTLRVTRLPV